MAKLGEVCVFYAGTGFPNEYQGRVTGKYPFYKVGDISKNVLEGNRELKTCANYVEEDVVQKLKGSILPPKTIVFAKIGEALKLNRRAITSCECLVDNNVMGIKAQNVRLNDEYLFYWLQNLNLSDYSESTTVPSVKKSRLQDVEINVNPLEEQEKVVSTLNKLSSLILARKKQLSKLDELVKAQFVEMFGSYPENENAYPVVNVSDIADAGVGVVIKPAQYYVTEECGIKAFRSLNIGEMYIKDSDWVYFSTEGNESNKKSQLHENDLLIVRSGAPGTSCVVTKEFEGCNAVDVIIAHPDLSKVNPWYLCAYINYPHGKKQIEEGTGGAAQQHFNVGKCNNLKVLLPPLESQNQFAAFVERVNQQKQTVQQSLEKLELMKKALMQEYFG